MDLQDKFTNFKIEERNKEKQELMKQTNNRRTKTGTPQSSTTFKSHNKQPQTKGKQKDQGKQSSKTPSTPRKSQSSWSSLKSPTRRSLSPWSQSSSSKSTYRKGKRVIKTPVKIDQPTTCKFWNKCQCSKGNECEFAHFHFKFFHKNSMKTTTNTISQYINQNYKNQVDNNKVLVHISQILFMPWTKVQEITQNMNEGVIQQITSIATLNKNAEKNYSKEVKNQRKTDDDAQSLIKQKINAFNQNYESLVKKNKKDDISLLKNNNNNNNEQKDQSKEQQQPKKIQQQQQQNKPSRQNTKMEEEKNKDKRISGESQQQTKMDEEISQPHKQPKQLSEYHRTKQTQNQIKQPKHQQLDQAPYRHTIITVQEIIISAAKDFDEVITKVDIIQIQKLIQAAQPNLQSISNQQQLIVNQPMEINKMYRSNLIQLITNNPQQVKQQFTEMKIGNSELQKTTKFVIYINAPLLQIITTQKNGIDKQDASGNTAKELMHAVTILITTTLNQALLNHQIMNEEDSMDIKQMKDYMMTALDTTKDFRQSRIIVLFENEKEKKISITQSCSSTSRQKERQISPKLNDLLKYTQIFSISL